MAVDLRGLHESLADVGHERVEPYPLGACPMAEVLAILTAAAGGETDINPVGYAVTMAGEAGGVDKGLGQEGLNAVGGRPIAGNGA